MKIVRALLLMTVFAVSACADLAAVRGFATDTVALADSVDLLAADSSASCFRRLALDGPIKNLPEAKRIEFAKVCAEVKQAAELFVDLNKVTSAYGKVLGQLADDKFVSFTSEVDGVKSSIGKIQDGAGKAYFQDAQLAATGSLVDLVLRAFTDAYRQREIKRVLEHHDDLVKHAATLRTFIVRGYLGFLSNEEGNLDGLDDIVARNFLKSEPLRARELVESIKQQRVKLGERRKAANDTLEAVQKMVDAHQKLRLNSDRLDDKLLVQLLDDYRKRIRDVRTQIQTAF